jgi:uncharacterized membrane protein YdjX (TVP38/TMEM64 family)
MNTLNNHSEHISWRNVVLGVVIAVLVAFAYWYMSKTGAIETICDCDSLNEFITRLGVFGPFAVIGLMAVAIVMSPIPSAPIALAAGMAYGHTWGTLYIVIGAEVGALIAFTLARLLGYEVLHKWFGKRLEMGLLGSQNVLMFIVFAGRLLPFISFDILSYAAGLTSLKFWRFAVATLVGIIPISFLIAHFGGELGSADMQKITTTVLILGSVTLIPVIVKWWIARHRKTSSSAHEKT